MHALILSLKASSKRLPRFDGVWLTSIVLLSGIGVFAAAQLAETLRFAFSSLIYMAPIMLVAISIAGSVRASGATSFCCQSFHRAHDTHGIDCGVGWQAGSNKENNICPGSKRRRRLDAENG